MAVQLLRRAIHLFAGVHARAFGVGAHVDAELLPGLEHGGRVYAVLLEQFVEKDYGDDLLLLTATDERDATLVGLIFWRYLRGSDDNYWQHLRIDWEASFGPNADAELVSGKPIADAFTMIELLCTDRAYRGRGIGKLLMVAALAYSAVKDGKEVLRVG